MRKPGPRRPAALSCVGLLSLLAITLFTGCGAGMIDVQGKVTLDGQPLPNVNVTFSDQVKHIRSSGVTDADGRYRLSTNAKNDGVQPGEYRVAVIQPGPADSSQAAPPRMFPERYERAETSNLTMPVPSKNYDIEIKKE